MITVLLGTGPYPFERLVKEVDKLAAELNWDVFIQLGYTTYEPLHCTYENFLNKNELIAKIRASEVIISHGGFGSIRDALANNKPVIVAPRNPELGELRDNHQIELIKELDGHGGILTVYDMNNLSEMVEKAKCFAPKRQTNTRIPEIIKNFLQEL
jgi:UDP-N-acetylglucosamine transferase subunit ALG13